MKSLLENPTKAIWFLAIGAALSITLNSFVVLSRQNSLKSHAEASAFARASEDVGILPWRKSTVEEAAAELGRQSFEVSMSRFEQEGVIVATRSHDSLGAGRSVDVLAEIRFVDGLADSYRLDIRVIDAGR